MINLFQEQVSFYERKLISSEANTAPKTGPNYNTSHNAANSRFLKNSIQTKVRQKEEAESETTNSMQR